MHPLLYLIAAIVFVAAPVFMVAAVLRDVRRSQSAGASLRDLAERLGDVLPLLHAGDIARFDASLTGVLETRLDRAGSPALRASLRLLVDAKAMATGESIRPLLSAGTALNLGVEADLQRIQAAYGSGDRDVVFVGIGSLYTTLLCARRESIAELAGATTQGDEELNSLLCDLGQLAASNRFTDAVERVATGLQAMCAVYPAADMPLPALIAEWAKVRLMQMGAAAREERHWPPTDRYAAFGADLRRVRAMHDRSDVRGVVEVVVGSLQSN